MMKKFIGILFLISSHAMAADWEVVGMSEKAVLFVDKSSVAQAAPYRKAWFKYVYSEKQDAKDTYPVKQYQSSLLLEYADCNARTMAVKQETLYAGPDRDGDVISTKSWKIAAASFDDVAPETIGERMIAYMCAFAYGSNRK